MEINWSRIIAVLSFIVTALTLLSTLLGAVIPHDYAILILGFTAAISAFVERIQGGASKV
jgi:hypothetical protein